ncbi:MAG: phage baseplate assembly protein V [Kofleriaceae bacterium]
MFTDFASYAFAQTRAAETESNRVDEVVIGVVTDIKDDGKLCRIKVKIPSMPISDNTDQCNWISLGGSKDRGWFSMPEVDDEVVIAFEHGDMRRPLVLGALWNGKDKASDNNGDGKNARRVIKSKTGHKVTFEDVEEFLSIVDGAGIGEIKIDKKNNKIEITASQGDVAIQCKDDLVVLAKEIKITGKTEVGLYGKSSEVNATGTSGVTIKGNLVNLKGSSIDVNPGGVKQAAVASATATNIPDPVKG